MMLDDVPTYTSRNVFCYKNVILLQMYGCLPDQPVTDISSV